MIAAWPPLAEVLLHDTEKLSDVPGLLRELATECADDGTRFGVVVRLVPDSPSSGLVTCRVHGLGRRADAHRARALLAMACRMLDEQIENELEGL